MSDAWYAAAALALPDLPDLGGQAADRGEWDRGELMAAPERRGARERPTQLEAGDLRLDPAARRAWRGDAELVFTAREFSLLQFLMSRAGEVLSKTEIVEHVWDFAFEGDLNIVEVYVGYLRKKIDAPFGRNAIQTIRLVGYRLDPDGG